MGSCRCLRLGCLVQGTREGVVGAGRASKRAAKLCGDRELSAKGEARESSDGDAPASASRTFFRGVTLLTGQSQVLPESDRIGRVVCRVLQSDWELA